VGAADQNECLRLGVIKAVFFCLFLFCLSPF
jgi:hypothetical protein